MSNHNKNSKEIGSDVYDELLSTEMIDRDEYKNNDNKQNSSTQLLTKKRRVVRDYEKEILNFFKRYNGDYMVFFRHLEFKMADDAHLGFLRTFGMLFNMDLRCCEPIFSLLIIFPTFHHIFSFGAWTTNDVVSKGCI